MFAFLSPLQVGLHKQGQQIHRMNNAQKKLGSNNVVQAVEPTKLSTEVTSQSNDEVPPDMWLVERITPYDLYYHGVRELLYAGRSEYQSIAVADIGPYGRALFLDGKIQTAEGDEALYHEPLVHVPCIAHGRPNSVLILGGGDGGAVREALRWKTVTDIVLVDIDEAVVSACRTHLPSISSGALDDPRCRLVIDDALHYLSTTEAQFDVIICDLTDPMEDSPSLSLFTVEFFQMIYERLLPRGTMSIQVGPSSLVESATLMPQVCATLRSVFEKVLPYQVFVPTFGGPLGMAVATDSMARLPVESDIDRIFQVYLKRPTVALDGRAMHGLFALPKYLVKAINDEKQIFTTEYVANAFGKGNLRRKTDT